jgi:hypothetical protein
MSTVKVRLQSNLNISFNHVIDTEIEPEEWAELSEKEKDQVIEEVVWDNVEAFVDEDAEDDEW